MSKINTLLILYQSVAHKILLGLFVLTFLSVLSITTPHASAETIGAVNLTVTVPSVCSLGVDDDEHSIEMLPGTHAHIGTSRFTAVCNDPSGLAIYTIGYTGEVHGDNRLTGTINGDTYHIQSHYTSGTPSSSEWYMTLSAVNGTYTPLITTGYDGPHTVPTTFTKVVYRNTATDVDSAGHTASGAQFDASFDIYAAPNQAAGTYEGKVKFVLVHPNDSQAPADSMLDTGTVVASKMKTLAAGESRAYNTSTTDIKAIKTANSLPANFTASEANTVSTSESKQPIYIFFDNTNDLGIMYFYTEGNSIIMNPESTYLFALNASLTDITGVANWDASRVETFTGAFYGDSRLTTLTGLENWDVSSVTAMPTMFYNMTSLTSLSALSSWNTGSVVNMSYTFANDKSLTSLTGLENWDVSSVENFGSTFGCYASPMSGCVTAPMNLTNISALTNWDTSSAIYMTSLFRFNASLSDLSPLSNWDTHNVNTLQYAFQMLKQLSTLHGLENWDTRSLENLNGAFSSCTSLTSLEGLRNWNARKIKSLANTFWGTTSLTSLDGLELWNTSSLENMDGTFGMSVAQGRTDTTPFDLTPLANWDVSHVTTMHTLFQNTNLASFLPIKDWDVSSVENFADAFNQTPSATLTTLAGLENWDVSSALDVNWMFADTKSLTDVSAINNWNIVNVEYTPGASTASTGNKFEQMFRGSSVYPNFTRRAGTWDNTGTFFPSE